MPRPPQHYSWLVSPYSAKTRSYLTYKGVEFDDRPPTLFDLRWTIRRAVGRPIMPTVRLPDGAWLQDSSLILDHFERTHPTPSITPPGPTQRLASALLELFADEWLPMAALHYRWSIPQNEDFALDEFANNALPYLPRRIRRRLIRPMAAKMRGYRPLLGVMPQTIPGVEETVQRTLRALEATLRQHPYLLGGRPALADFSLYGPLWAHLYRDPGTTSLFDEHPAVVTWMERLRSGDHPPIGDFAAADEIPAGLRPIFECVLEDQLPWIQTLVDAIDGYCEAHPDATRVPRSLGQASFQIRGYAGGRRLITFVQWKAQRARRAYEAAQGAADPWLASLGAQAPERAVPVIAHPFNIVDYRAMLA